MKKGVFIVVLLMLLLSFMPAIFAQGLNQSQTSSAYSCVSNKVGDCSSSSLSISDKIFTSLATGQCTSQVKDKETNAGCWASASSSSCDIKTTSEALIALANSGASSNQTVSWILSQQQPTTSIDWYIQVDSNSPTSCSISYNKNSYKFSIGSDKTLTTAGGLGSCLEVGYNSNNYWIHIKDPTNCYGVNFTTTCDQPFTTTKLYQKSGDSTVYVSKTTQSASAGGPISDMVNSYCFGDSTGCDYESTMWAALALDGQGYNIAPYLPYLTTSADDPSNVKYLPSAILYYLTGSNDYLQSLLNSQIAVNQYNYWSATGSPYTPEYDTALALFSLTPSSSVQQKQDAEDWLANTQGSDGCWGSVADTSFLLYALEGSTASAATSSPDCASAGYYCMSQSSCTTQANGNVLSGYSCNLGTYICCDQPVVTPSCAAQQGQVCQSGYTCDGGQSSPASNLTSGQICCVGAGATCKEATQPTISSCESAGDACRSTCFSSEQISQAGTCNDASQFCCEPKPQKSSSGVVLIILLIILILLAALGIIFRKRLLPIWIKIKSKFKKGPGKGGPSGRPGPGGPRPPPGFRPGPGRPMPPRPMPSRPMPQRRPVPGRPRSASDVNDVLKKLKEMGK